MQTIQPAKLKPSVKKLTSALSGEKNFELKWWQNALIAVGVSFLGSLSGSGSSKADRKIYTSKFKQAPWAPPAWVFAPAWTLNNYFLIKAIERILSKKMPDKSKLLMLQGLIWTVFFSFNYVFFRKKSPVLANFLTMADNVFAIASFIMAFRSDKKTAYNYLPLLLWTTFASTLSGYQALKNPDPVLKTKALL